MRIAILSDIHGNLEALHACLQKLEGLVQDWYCLGDLVGYGADPNACVDLVRVRCRRVLLGNHDAAVSGLLDLEWFNPVAREAAEWTRGVLTAENLAYLSSLPERARERWFEAVHGSLVGPVEEYVDDFTVACGTFERMETSLCLIGHTHLAGAFLWPRPAPEEETEEPEPAPGDEWAPVPPTGPPNPRQVGYVDLSRGGGLRLNPARRYIVNCGSVGQPRDGNWQAACGVVDTELMAAQVLRVPYDLEAAQEKIRRAGLPDPIWRRLEHGQ